MAQQPPQIRERAGLEESRINQEFVDFLRKWSTPVLFVIAALAVGYVVFQRTSQAREERVNRAFVELDQAGGLRGLPPSPESLKRVAEEFESVRGVPLMARLRAADEYLRVSRIGMHPGARPLQDGSAASPEDIATEEDSRRYLDEAASLYRRVLADSEKDPGKLLFTINALFGLAAVDESRGDLDGARQHYERIVALTDGTAFAIQARAANKRIADLPSLATPRKLLAQRDLPYLEGVDPPKPPPAPELPPEGPLPEGPPPEQPGEAPPEPPPADSPR